MSFACIGYDPDHKKPSILRDIDNLNDTIKLGLHSSVQSSYNNFSENIENLHDCEKLDNNYNKIGLSKIGQSSYVNSQGRIFTEMLLNKIQFMDLMTGYSLEL